MEINSNEGESQTGHKKLIRSEKFRYGNYNRYYGTRNKGLDHDPRLDVLPVEWFRNQFVLDIGCNVGHLTLSIAKKFQPHRIVGIDIDGHLIGSARKNIRHYCEGNQSVGKYPVSFSKKPIITVSTGRKRKIKFYDGFSEGEHEPSSSDLTRSVKFPDNVWFVSENYVLECDELLELVREEYDVILALSITKWIHLNWGDAGIRRFFKRVFRNLRPGGRFILEVQDYATYSKRAKILPEMMENYRKLELRPESFNNYLLSEEVGFERSEELTTPTAVSKGYKRPIHAFFKRSFVAKVHVNGNVKNGVGAKSQLDNQ